MNKVILIGNLANDPEARTTQSGISQSTFRIAVQRRYVNQQGVREADFLTVIAWRGTADFCNKYLKKGRRVAVEGSIQTRNYDAQDGTKRYVTEILAESVEAVDSRRADADDPGPTPPPEPKAREEKPQQQRMNYYGDNSSDDFTEVDDDELPF